MITITGHFERPKVKRLAEKTKTILQRLGAECIAANIKTKKFNAKNINLVVAIGGDGTMLRIVRELKEEKPVIGIAAGGQSALMQVKPTQLRQSLNKIVKGNHSIQRRMRLQAEADGKKLPLALNEVMLVNKKSGAIVSYCLHVNGKRLYCKKGDGCIIATPTGSSSHAYSAGGKRLPVGSKKIAIVPSNPFNRSAKTLYRGSDSKIVLSSFNAKQSHEVVVDGRPRFPVKKRLVVKKGKNAFFLKI